MSGTYNFVVLGGSGAGLGIAHSFLKHIEPELKKLGKTYHVYIVDSSSHFFWNTGSPRSVVSAALLPADKLFMPIADGFKSYDSSLYTVIHGTAESWDVRARTVTIKLADGENIQALPYYALVLATGLRTPSPATSLHGNYTNTKTAIEDLNRKFASAKSVIVCGGGPTGVETAGEAGHFLNGSAGWFSSFPSNPKAKVTLITKADRLLPVLSKPRALTGEMLLNKVGVDVVYNVGVISSTTDADGKTTVNLSNGEQWTADVYIPAWGTTPNSEYVPVDLKNDQGYIKTNGTTLRADAAGPRVYVAGDIGDYSRGGFHNLYGAIPVLATNIKRDLLAAAAFDTPDAKPEGPDRLFTSNNSETQAVPIGPRGVGALNGWPFPSFLIWLLKGRDYMVGNIPATVNGKMVMKDNT
ncbi:FAD/NAD(P)-binding domain-containing protein [Periconia macrospinosa]|uniref:FAD/NAD(P)-binding domain-containing protein n=1 Tax=Periconia macrospinosa TaxID=97972 RepID=A0A2V1D2Q6_9PLEO|nr:FAD/NAD(P)-binding domain-containing protein [Periconia macrospinosa]